MGTSSGLQFCGPATAKVTVRGQTYSFKAGFCSHDLAHTLALQLSLGTDIPSFGGGGKPNQGRPLFELVLGTASQAGTLLTLDLGGRQLVADDIHVRAHYDASSALSGTLSGRDVSGSWNCKGTIYQLDPR
jgi:hypothetical protein